MADGFEPIEPDLQKYVFGNLEHGHVVRFIDSRTHQARELRFKDWDRVGNAVVLDEATQQTFSVPDTITGFNSLYEPGSLFLKKGSPTEDEILLTQRRIAEYEAERRNEALAKEQLEAQARKKEEQIDAEIKRETQKLSRHYGDLSKCSKATLEKAMTDLIAKDPGFRNPDNEGRYYILMREYAKFIPEYDSAEAVRQAGLLRVRNREVVSDYIMSYTNLGALSLRQVSPGKFQVLGKRGMTYFRGTDHPDFGSNSAINFITSPVAKRIYGQGFGVVIAIPGTIARGVLGHSVSGTEIMLNPTLVPEVLLFRVKERVRPQDLK